MGDIKLDPEIMQQVIGKAILEAIPQDQRNNILKDAIDYLLTPIRSTYSSNIESPLQSAYNSALRKLAEQECRTLLENNDSVHKKIQELISEGVVRALADNRDKLINKITSVVCDGLFGKGY